MPTILRIGDLTLDTGRQRLTRGTVPIHLGPLTYKLLLALVEAAPNVASHDELASAVWNGRSVSPETVSQRVKLLRDAIGDHAIDPRYVELVRERGYRLLPPVEAIEPADPPRRRQPPLWFAAAAILVVAAAALLIRAYVMPDAASPTSTAIAVLPFADMSPGQDHEYLADGIAEEILNALSASTSLRVIARTSSFSFKDRNADIATIAKQLNVSHIVEGSVRRSGSNLRVTVQLISAADGTHIWSATYDGGLVDILQLQDEIARSVSAALEAELIGPVTAARARQPVNPKAYDLYLRGRQRLRDNRLGDAERYLEQSLAIDATFVPAYAALGEAYVRRIVDYDVPLGQYREKLRDLLERGFEYAPDDAGLIGLSGQLARYDGDIGLAEQRFRQALERDPSNVTVQQVYTMLKGDQGYPEQALDITRPAREIDPLNPLVYLGDWSVAMDLGDAKEALKATERYAKLAAPDDSGALLLRSITRMVLLGDLAGAARDWAAGKDIDTSGATRSYTDPLWYYVLGDLENGDAAREVYDRLVTKYPGDAFALVYRHLVTGEIAKARELVLPLFIGRGDYSAFYEDAMIARLAVDALIDRGDANLAIDIIEDLAPQYATFRAVEEMAPDRLSPAPYPVKSIYSSYPALYFPDYIRALRAAGHTDDAENMLNHLEGVLQWRRARGLLVEERHVAEARALRGDYEGALKALEQAVGDRTIFQGWHVFLLHNPIFADIRDHPRFVSIVEQVRNEVQKQRAELSESRSKGRQQTPSG
jgi:TolB-like protein/DNA-binding winged helix-turn-helix (wHTH) protein